MRNIPKNIFLVTGTDWNIDFKELSEVTWSEDRIYNSDLHFISLDFLREKMEKLKEERLTDFFISTDYRRRIQIKLLNDIINEVNR